MVSAGIDETTAPDYRSLVWRKRGRFYFHLPELGILVNDSDLKSAYEKLEAAQESMIKEFRDAGADIPSPRYDVDGSPFGWRRKQDGGRFFGSASQIGQFVVKTVIVGIVAAFFLNLSWSYVGTRIEPTNLGRRAYSYVHLTAKLFEEAPPEVRETFRRDLRIIARELSPFVEGLAQPPKPVAAGKP